jgi:hypothetical protein
MLKTATHSVMECLGPFLQPGRPWRRNTRELPNEEAKQKRADRRFDLPLLFYEPLLSLVLVDRVVLWKIPPRIRQALNFLHVEGVMRHGGKKNWFVPCHYPQRTLLREFSLSNRIQDAAQSQQPCTCIRFSRVR